MIGRGALVLACAFVLLPAPALAQKLYKHTDEKGNVVYSDRPNAAGQPAEKQKPVNAGSPEATRQTEILRQEALRARRQDEFAARRRAAAAQPPVPSGRPTGTVVIRDPNLPPTPPADSQRRYYYDGR